MIQFDRHIFTDKPTRKEKLADYLLAILLAIVGALALLHGLDALFY